jgi:hypothetical protein
MSDNTPSAEAFDKVLYRITQDLVAKAAMNVVENKILWIDENIRLANESREAIKQAIATHIIGEDTHDPNDLGHYIKNDFRLKQRQIIYPIGDKEGTQNM